MYQLLHHLLVCTDPKSQVVLSRPVVDGDRQTDHKLVHVITGCLVFKQPLPFGPPDLLVDLRDEMSYQVSDDCGHIR